jgi:hypothetical protein
MRIFAVLCGVLLLGGSALAADAVPAAAYFPVLPFEAAVETAPRLVPVATNHALEGNHAGLTRAVIVIHDESRDANAALATLMALAGTMNGSTMIVAPQFMLPSDLARFADHLPEKGRSFASWPLAGWPEGEESVTVPGQKNISSFAVIDLLLMYLSDRRSFPDMQRIVIAGYGAGAKFTQRYAAFSSAADVIARQNIDLHFLVAAAPSFLYMTASRPMGGKKGFGVPDPAVCPDYNAYPYGLEKLNAYARRSGVNAAKTGYAMRFTTYLNSAMADPLPETKCGALVQGKDSAVRAAHYRQYLQSLYSDVAGKTQLFAVPKDAKNDAIGLYGSACGMTVLFGDGLCPPSLGEAE